LGALLGPATAVVQASHAVPASRARQAVGFWTAARMKRARPLDVPRVESSAVAEASAGDGSRPHVYPPLAPTAPAAASSALEAVTDPTAPLARTNGVVFIATPFGLGRCSGTSVNAPNYSVVFTAGHCVHTGGPHGSWLDFHWAFVPGYRYGQRPFGIFAAKWLDTTRQWRATGNDNFDVAAAVVGRNERGKRLGKEVGGTGIAWGLKARQVFDVHGYPVAPPFDGETQRVCAQAPFLGHDPR